MLLRLGERLMPGAEDVAITRRLRHHVLAGAVEVFA
jgi:hypothetical protein